VAREYLDDLRGLALKRLETESNKRLIDHPQLGYLLFRWQELAQDDGATVRSWTGNQLEHDEAVARFAKAFTRETWTQGMGMAGLGDRVAVRNLEASMKGLEKVLDVENFRRRLDELRTSENLAEPYRGMVATFLEALERKRRDD
jgi:hypothetical protein